MKVEFVSQASMIAHTDDAVIWTDPWLHGKAFNESWALFPEPTFTHDDLAPITHLWISHEHPDHFHVPTLKSLPDEFKQRVHVLFQENNSDKVVDAMQKFGFRTFTRMPNRTWLDLTPQTSVYCAQIGNMDSSLAVRGAGKTLLNLNDCEANSSDCRRLKKDIGQIDVLFNQFSLAGYSGEADRDAVLPPFVRIILDNMRENHRDLDAGATIPFASNICFCKPDNKFLNQYGNTPRKTYDTLTSQGVNVTMLYPGDAWEVGTPHDSTEALRRFDELYDRMDEIPIDDLDTVPYEQIEEAFAKRAQHLHEKYPRWSLKRLNPVTCHIPDLERVVRFSIVDKTLETIGMAPEETDIIVNSQPLDFTFRWPWGMQTLGVSARGVLCRNEDNWMRHRVLFAMDNAEVHLRPHLLFTRKNAKWLVQRCGGLANQVRFQLKRMRPAA